MNRVFHPDAVLEFEEGVRYYRARGRVLEDDVRRCVVRVFLYSVLYTIEADFILIVAVMHGKRQPGYWRYRVGPARE